MKYKDYYAALGVPRDADLEQIKKAYRKLARQYHPDVSKAADANVRFKEAAKTYATLKHSEKRAVYDELGRRPGGAWQGTVPANGRDYEDAVHISLIDAHRGTTFSLNLADHEDGRTLEIKILPGVREGQKIKLRGKGGKGCHGGDDGDIYLHIAQNQNSLFRAYHHDLYFDLAVAPWEAALGTELEVPTLDGKALLTVPSGTRTGRQLRPVRGALNKENLYDKPRS